MSNDGICRIKLSGALAYEGEISLAIAHQILGIAINGVSTPAVQNNAFSAVPDAKAGATAKSFIATKRPKTDVEKIACLAFFLTHYTSTARFKTADLERVATEAAIDISNFPRAVDNATRQSKFLAKAGTGTKQITILGESVVEALPDRDAVATVLKEKPPRRRKRKTKGKRN